MVYRPGRKNATSHQVGELRANHWFTPSIRTMLRARTGMNRATSGLDFPQLATELPDIISGVVSRLKGHTIIVQRPVDLAKAIRTIERIPETAGCPVCGVTLKVLVAQSDVGSVAVLT